MKSLGEGGLEFFFWVFWSFFFEGREGSGSGEFEEGFWVVFVWRRMIFCCVCRFYGLYCFVF